MIKQSLLTLSILILTACNGPAPVSGTIPEPVPVPAWRNRPMPVSWPLNDLEVVSFAADSCSGNARYGVDSTGKGWIVPDSITPRECGDIFPMPCTGAPSVAGELNCERLISAHVDR